MKSHGHTNVKYNLYVFINSVYHYFYTVKLYPVIMSVRFIYHIMPPYK